MTFQTAGFQTQFRSVTLAPTQLVEIDVTIDPAAVSESVTIAARSTDILTHTPQVATNFKQELLATLPTNRDITSAVLQAPGVHATGPGGVPSINGSTSFQSLTMVDGVTITDNLRGGPLALYVEDAIEETTVSVGGVSAEYGRFSGGVVNVVTKSGGNQFSGSFRDTYNNDRWRTLTPFETAAIAADPEHRELRVNAAVPAYEYALGGPIRKDRLWFFTAGRLQTLKQGLTLTGTNIPYTYGDQTRRYEGKVTYSATSRHRFQEISSRSSKTRRTTRLMSRPRWTSAVWASVAIHRISTRSTTAAL